MSSVPGVAVVLPGEGGALPGLADPWLLDPVAAEVVARASAVAGRDLARWWREPLALPDREAADLEVVVTGVAAWRSLTARGLRPVAVAGHGVGEYAALVAAGALDLEQVVELVRWRADLMALAPRPSRAGMAAVVGDGAAEVARAVVARSGGGTLAVACYDGPAQAVLCGEREELARARWGVLAAGLDLVRLPGRPACHGPLARPVAEHLAAALAELTWSVPAVPVVPNADPVPSQDPERLAQSLADHLTAPVRWEETSRALVSAGAVEVLEVGGAPVLGPLVRQVHPRLPVRLVTGPASPLTAPAPPAAAPAPALAGTAPVRGGT
ncbi:ACP S-malonyltransferase [Trujillonella endophytica]|uniref:[acyl-carrier-protein] S-malonyltransferase n=1 Tax=Trujillonella endophytica TaxID=673521 RepID=A0A1H8WEH8_9ACTN|nr:ACP S-malonyltransferase [Trujillella endophytica]SEP25837.1 [acyl-carrier-protein] S-malonyltransferase [Trujillella endophytica]